MRCDRAHATTRQVRYGSSTRIRPLHLNERMFDEMTRGFVGRLFDHLAEKVGPEKIYGAQQLPLQRKMWDGLANESSRINVSVQIDAIMAVIKRNLRCLLVATLR